MDTPTPTAPNHAGGPAGRRRRRVRLVVVLVVFFLVVGGLSAAVAKYRGCQQPPIATGDPVAFQIPPGATGQDVVAALDERGLIRCGGFVGNLLLRGTGKAGKILAGTYDLQVGMSLDQIVGVITTPPPKVPTVRLTVPEGLRISTTYPGERSISSEVADQTGLSAKDFASLADSGRYALPPFLPRTAGTAEGFLFPDTYQLVRKGLTSDSVIRRMLDQFQTEADSLDLAGGAEKLGLTPYEVVIVASMIEREAQVEEDRPKIASVIYNRLAQGMSLGIDATLLYDDPTPDGQLSTSDLLTNNPYNTRINAGLPPTPIASPGRASLDAALHPADTPYLYYVLCPPDGDGVHRFARTLHQHNVNVQQCLG
jgi:peptidoglycan lytic transglycosylase G